MAKSQTDIIQYFSTPAVQIVAIDKNSTSENTTSTVTAEHSIASRTSSDNASKGGGVCSTSDLQKLPTTASPASPLQIVSVC